MRKFKGNQERADKLPSFFFLLKTNLNQMQDVPIDQG
jgi:hypothetical protein